MAPKRKEATTAAAPPAATRHTPVYPPIPPGARPPFPPQSHSPATTTTTDTTSKRPRPRSSQGPTTTPVVNPYTRMRSSDLVAPEITYHVPQTQQQQHASSSSSSSSLVRPQPPRPMESRPPPAVVTPVPPPRPPMLLSSPAAAAAAAAERSPSQQQKQQPPRADRNIDKVVLGDLCFRTWYPSYYPKELVGDLPSAGAAAVNAHGRHDHHHHHHGHHHNHQQPPMLERLYVCPSCFKYSRELVAWWGHVRVCERRDQVPGRKVYTHPRGRRKVLVPQGGGSGVKRRRGTDGGVRYAEQTVEDRGEWSIWEVDGEDERLYCQNLSLFAKLFLDNKSVFFDVTGFNYFLLAYTPAAAATDGRTTGRPQVVGFFSKEKMSWDSNNLACILVFPPWQRKGLGALLMGASYEISRRDGVVGGPEKPISELGRKGYRRFWAGEVARWLLDLPADEVVDVRDCSEATWIAVEDCLGVLREMELVEDAGVGPGRVRTKDDEDGDGAEVERRPPPPQVPRVKIDKEAVGRYVAAKKLNLERTCDAESFVGGWDEYGRDEVV